MSDDKLREQQREHFNSISEQYRAARASGNHVVVRDLIWSDFMSRNDLRSDKRLKILEPMCGFAEGFDIASRFLQAEIDYEGYDYSDAVISSLQAQRPELSVWQADAIIHRPPPATYDGVLLLGALHHVHKDAAVAVANIVQSLKPGGWLISLEPTHGNPVTALVRNHIYKRHHYFDAETERGFSVRELFDLFSAAGLTTQDACYPGLLSYVLYYNPDAFPQINLGGEKAVQSVFGFDRLFMYGPLGKLLSFATLSLWRKL